MPDIVSKRETFILVTDENGLYPAETLYPSDDLFPKDAGLTQITNIVAGSLKLEEHIVEKIPQFGQIFASKFECKVYLTDDLQNKVIQVYQMDDGVYKPVFVGVIDSCKLDKIGTDRKIVAYDFAYTVGQTNIASWWEQFWLGKQSSTLKQCRDAMLTWAGITFENVELPNDNLVITKTVGLTNCSLNNMLRMMCELNYCFPHFDRNGELIFIILNTEPEQTLDLTGLYEWQSSDFEEFITSPIDGVQFFDSGNELKYSVGGMTNAYPIKQNIFLYNQGTQILIDIGEELLSYLQDFEYTPSKLKMIASDLSYSLGDYVHTEKGNFYIFKNALSGAQLFEQQLQANGQPVLYGAKPHMNYGEIILDEKISRVSQSVEEFYIEYADFKEGTYSRFTQTDQKIQTEVTRASTAEGNLSSRITQTANAITSEVTRASTAEGNLSSRITQTANGLSAEITRSTNAEGTLSASIRANATAIETKVSKNGVISSINQSSEAVTINANKVNLNGYVTVNSLKSGGSTVIDGSRIQTGIITGHSGDFSLNFNTGKVVMNNAEFKGSIKAGSTITGSKIQTRDTGKNILLDKDTSALQGRNGTTPVNWINMANNSNYIVIDSGARIIMATPSLAVSTSSTSGGGGTANLTRTDSPDDYSDEMLDSGRKCYRLLDVRKWMPSDFDWATQQALGIQEFEFPNQWGEQTHVTLPVLLKIRYRNERRIHGMVIEDNITAIPNFTA